MKNYCPELFSSVFVQKVSETQVELGHCCTSRLSPHTNDVDINHKFLSDGRQYYLDTGELPPACIQCVDSESRGFATRRTSNVKTNIRENYFPTEVKLKKLDYNCDNICNLKCIICSSYYSSSWIDDEQALGFKGRTTVKHTKHNTSLYSTDVSELKKVYFNGGEPLMTRDHLNVLDYIIKHGNPSEIDVSYSSNGTFPPTPELIELWKKFYTLTMHFSIDAIGEQFNYIRYPGNWSQVEQNLIEFRRNKVILKSNLNCFVTVGIHNIMYFDQIYNWATIMGFPVYIQDTTGNRSGLSLRNFPVHLKPQLLSYLHSLPDSDPKASLITQAELCNNTDTVFVRFLNQLDTVRGTDWKKSLSRLYDLDPKFFDNVPKYIPIRK